MLELPEAKVLSKQITETLTGNVIKNVIVEHTPHKLTWFYGKKEEIKKLLIGKTLENTTGYGGLVEIKVSDAYILFGDGANIRFFENEELIPEKHQLLLEFSNGKYLISFIQMYGGIGAFKIGELDNPYYKSAKEKPSPFTDSFNDSYFFNIIENKENQKLSVKALLATEQRIPGIGNGVLQDILFNAQLHPKRKTFSLTDNEKTKLFFQIKNTLNEMAIKGGRDTEKDLFGQSGKYITKMSKNTMGKSCLICGNPIKKEAYLGGSIYYCNDCQKMNIS